MTVRLYGDPSVRMLESGGYAVVVGNSHVFHCDTQEEAAPIVIILRNMPISSAAATMTLSALSWIKNRRQEIELDRGVAREIYSADPPAAGPRVLIIVHFHEGDSKLSPCGLAIDNVIWTASADHVSCFECLEAIGAAPAGDDVETSTE